MLKSVLQLLAVIAINLSLASPASFAAGTQQTLSFDNWVERLKKQALSNGISQDTLNQAFLTIKPIDQTASFASSANTYSVNQYLALPLSAPQVNYQKQLLQRYNNILFEISHLFGVEPEVLIAVWTIDNLDAANKPKFNVIELLTSTSFKQPSNKQVQTELFHALKLMEDRQVNPLEFTSDENGLLGSTYFKPSILRTYGIDYDGDGVIDIWKNYADIFASTANYLSSIGWKGKERWGVEVSIPENVTNIETGTTIQRTINYWRTLGVTQFNGADLPIEDALGTLIRPDPESNRTFLVLDNYFALLRWKRSVGFALAVGLMTDRLMPERKPDAPLSLVPVPAN